MTQSTRIRELTTRQVYYGSSLVCKLVKRHGIFYYQVWAWLDQNGSSIEFLWHSDKYSGEDPEELFEAALKEIGAKKIKLGVIL